MMMDEKNKLTTTPVASGLAGHCPRCGKGHLFKGFLSIRDRCEVCGLDYDFVDSADGPAVFVIMFVGFLITGAALIVEIMFKPPYWVHAALWLPLGIALPLLVLRPLKGALIGLQYRNSASEARFDVDGNEL